MNRSAALNEFAERIQRRDEHALECALSLYAPRGMGVLWVHTRGTADSEDLKDLYQRFAIRLWQRIESFDPARGQFVTWLDQLSAAVAREFARTERRRHRIMKRALEIDAFESTSRLEGDPIDRIARRQQSLLLREALHGLAEGEAAILKGWMDGASTAELAKRMGISAAATRTRLSRARANLVRALRGT